MMNRAFSLGIAFSLGVVLLACDSYSGLAPLPTDALATGTWGGERAGVIVAGSAHVHIGCTNGEFPGPITLDEAGRFSVSGSYVLRAFPVQIGPRLPAQLAGVVTGRRLTLSVAVNDTVEKKLVVLGPVVVTYGREPIMGPCPICRK
jgi:hypothetical protein